MSGEQRSAFLKRSLDKFGCDAATVPPIPPPASPIRHSPTVSDHLYLFVGAITSPEASSVAKLLDALASKINSRSDVTLKVTLLENGGHDDESRDELRKVVDSASRGGVDIDLKTLEQQALDTDVGSFTATHEQLSGRKSIASSRTMLQRYLFLAAKPQQGAVVWILDDDVVLEGLGYGAEGPTHFDIDYVSEIKRLKETDSCVVLGEVTGDPPLPFLSCIRTQLVDLYHNLHQLACLRPDAPYPNRSDENRLTRLESCDYYYDLSRSETGHLESPFWYEASEKGLLAGHVFGEMMSRLPDILGGKQVFRPLMLTDYPDPVSRLVPSVKRGPTTLVFDLQTLREFPNAVLTHDGSDVRRSDMVWSLLNRFVGGCKVVQTALPVRQDRGPVTSATPDLETLAQDIRGHAFYSSLHDVFLQKTQQRQRQGRRPYGRELLDFNDNDIRLATGLYSKYMHERLRAFELSFLRIIGLVQALRPFYDLKHANVRSAWWLGSPEHDEFVSTLRSFVSALDSIYTQAQLDEFKQRVLEEDPGSIERHLRTLPGIVALHRSNVPLPESDLIQAAKTYVQKEFGTGPLTCLGIGEEGVVLTDGRLAYKYFHYWKSRDVDREVAFLRSLTGKLSGYETLLNIWDVHSRGDHVVMAYTYETGTKYSGGRLDEMLTLLRECREAGIVCRNIHPDNLLVTEAGLKLIDYGSDIVPANDGEFEQMCRRAFLTYRFPFRSDLKRLMTKSLTDTAMPELAGFGEFMNALYPRDGDDLFHRPMADLVLAERPSAVLDYGCGDGRLIERIAAHGIAAIGYDPDEAVIAQCHAQRRECSSGAVRYGGSELLGELLASSARFDTVVCSRVLCTIHDPTEVDSVLRDLRRLVVDGGTVFVAMCNSFYHQVVSTELAEKKYPNEYDYEDTFIYSKTVHPDNTQRQDVHRSFATYKRAFVDAGFRVERVLEFDGTDTRYLRPASDNMVFRLSPSSVSGPRVSLLIKTCYMEWQIVERLVRHQVAQLEEPITFAEKVVIVDPSTGPLSRQYNAPNPSAHRSSMDRLVRDGMIDRVVYAPEAPEVIRSAYTKWFGVESDKTHSTNGQQLFATLYGFDACTGDYVLQMDCDLLIARVDRGHDYLGEMAEVLRNDPDALFVPLSICRSGPLPYTHEGPQGDWRVEVRGCLFDRRRLQSVLPIPNEQEDNRFAMAWHRAFDRFIASSEYHSYRGGDPRTATIHVPNDRKTDVGGLFDVIGAVERGCVPAVQLESVDLTGSDTDWAGPKRREPFVFVICGRNVDPGRFKRCFDSLLAQDSSDWGAIVVDDASTNGFGDYAETLIAKHADRITLVKNSARMGALYNIWNAVTRFCADPGTVILTLDADDALIGRHVLERVRAEYEDGGDVTVGSMLRLDKEATYIPIFDDPRSWQSNVWQHLRTFRKYLFDTLSVEDMKLDGQWIDRASDWAFMVPIIEMAASPRYIPDHLYLYEPSDQKLRDDKHQRDAVIARILAKPSYRKFE